VSNLVAFCRLRKLLPSGHTPPVGKWWGPILRSDAEAVILGISRNAVDGLEAGLHSPASSQEDVESTPLELRPGQPHIFSDSAQRGENILGLTGQAGEKSTELSTAYLMGTSPHTGGSAALFFSRRDLFRRKGLAPAC
jgi:hypothetical protein